MRKTLKTIFSVALLLSFQFVVDGCKHSREEYIPPVYYKAIQVLSGCTPIVILKDAKSKKDIAALLGRETNDTLLLSVKSCVGDSLFSLLTIPILPLRSTIMILSFLPAGLQVNRKEQSYPDRARHLGTLMLKSISPLFQK